MHNNSSLSASIAATSAALASMAAARAKRERCLTIMHGFTDAAATVEQKQEYADAVQYVHPPEAESGERLFYKVMILTVFIGTPLGAWKLPQYLGGGYSIDWAERVFGGIIGFLAGPLVMFVGLAIFAAIAYLFSSSPTKGGDA